MEGGPPIFRQDGSCPALLEDMGPGFPYGAVTRSGPPFQTLPVPKTHATGLFRVRSPLLTESQGVARATPVLMSVPPATEMFQFAGFASRAYGFSTGYPLPGGLPHSEIPGSTIARISPGLFAACHVLHRLSVPRHPPDALDLRLNPGLPLVAKDKTAENRRAQGQDPPGGSPGTWSRGPDPKGPDPGIGRNLGCARAATSHEDTSRAVHAQAIACAGAARLGHTQSLFTRQSTPAPQRPPTFALGRPRHETVFPEPRSARLPAAHRRPAKCRFAGGRNRVARVVEVPLVEVPLVEVNGIEPMTSCLQSRRSPN